MLLVRSLLLLFWLLGAEVAADSEVQQHGPFQILEMENPNDLTPSFLETEIEEVQEEIFPAKLNISLTLGSTRGLLLYSFDKNNNQLILSLFENDQIYIKVKLRNDDFTEDLVSLCGCKRNCLFETLNLTLEIPSSTLRIQCNDRPAVEHKVPYAVDIDRNYPAIKVGSKSKKNAARMWMVNHPRIGSSIPETRQMVGCIHAVRYRDQDVAFTARGPQLRWGCPDACAKQADICNLGSCVGTLNDRPVCDCTAALLMGKTCTDKLNTNSSKTAKFDYRFSSLKVSWSSGTNRSILLLQLKTFNITIFSVEEELRLQQKFYTNVRLTTHAEVLLHKYDPRRAHTAILRFQEEKISIQMPMDNDRVSLIPLERSPELGRSFVYLTLYSQPGGAADAAIRYTELDIEWFKIDWTILEGNSAVSSNISKEKMAVIVLGSILALVVVGAAVAALILIVARKKMKMRQKLRRRWRRDDPEMLAPLLDGDNEEKMSMVLRLRRWLCRRRSTVDDAAALWEFVRSLLRWCGEMRTVANAMVLTDDDPRLKIAEIKFELWFILDKIRSIGDLYQDPFVFGHWQSLSSILLNLSSSSRSIGSDIDRLRNESQRLILAIVNVAITKSWSGPAKVEGSAFVSTLTALRSRYDDIKSIKSSLGIAQSKSRVRDVVHRCSLKLTSHIAGPIRGKAEYERDEFVRRRCREIEERIQKMGESAECDEEWINHVRLLGGLIQSLMLAIVNVKMGTEHRWRWTTDRHKCRRIHF